MQWRTPLYLGEGVRSRAAEYRFLLENISKADHAQLSFYVIISAANPQNLMELIPASHLKQAYYQVDRMRFLGLASDKNEAVALCEKMITDCFNKHGSVDQNKLWDGEDSSGDSNNGDV